MNRKQFLKTSILGTISGFIVPNLLVTRNGESKLKETNDIQKSEEDLSIYTVLAKIAPLGKIYFFYFAIGESKYNQYFNWNDPANENMGGIQVGNFKYNLVNTMEKKIYYWKGLLEFYENCEVFDRYFIDNPSFDWLIEIYHHNRFQSNNSSVWLGYCGISGDTHTKIKINSYLVKFIQDYE